MCVCVCVHVHVVCVLRVCVHVCVWVSVCMHMFAALCITRLWSRHKKMTLCVWSSNKTFLVQLYWHLAIKLYHWHCKIWNLLSSVCLFVDSPRVWTQLTVLETEKCRHDHRPGDHCQVTDTDQTGQQADRHEADLASDWHSWKTDTKAKDRPGNRSTSEDRQTQRQGDTPGNRSASEDRQTQRQGDTPGNRSTSEDRHKGKRHTRQQINIRGQTDTKARRQTRQQINIRGQTDTKARRQTRQQINIRRQTDTKAKRQTRKQTDIRAGRPRHGDRPDQTEYRWKTDILAGIHARLYTELEDRHRQGNIWLQTDPHRRAGTHTQARRQTKDWHSRAWKHTCK